MENTQNSEALYKVAKKLFLKDGYKKTTIRKIAEQAGTSTGLVIYHFSAKRSIALKIILEHFCIIHNIVRKYVNLEKNPMLYTAVHIRLNRHLWFTLYKEFYLETLDGDIYTEAIEKSGMQHSIELVKKLNLNNHDDYINFYFNYLPVSIERSLTLSKERGDLQKILEDDIPDFIFRSSVDRFITDKDQIESICRESRHVVQNILKKENFSELA